MSVVGIHLWEVGDEQSILFLEASPSTFEVVCNINFWEGRLVLREGARDHLLDLVVVDYVDWDLKVYVQAFNAFGHYLTAYIIHLLPHFGHLAFFDALLCHHESKGLVDEG